MIWIIENFFYIVNYYFELLIWVKFITFINKMTIWFILLLICLFYENGSIWRIEPVVFLHHDVTILILPFFLKLILKWSKKNIEYICSFFMPFNDKSKFSIMQWWSFRFQLINISKSRNNYLNINMAVVSLIKSKEVERAYTLLETCLCYACGHSLMTRNILNVYDNIMQFLWIQVRSIKPPPPTFWHRKDFS